MGKFELALSAALLACFVLLAGIWFAIDLSVKQAIAADDRSWYTATVYQYYLEGRCQDSLKF